MPRVVDPQDQAALHQHQPLHHQELYHQPQGAAVEPQLHHAQAQKQTHHKSSRGVGNEKASKRKKLRVQRVLPTPVLAPALDLIPQLRLFSSITDIR